MLAEILRSISSSPLFSSLCVLRDLCVSLRRCSSSSFFVLQPPASGLLQKRTRPGFARGIAWAGKKRSYTFTLGAACASSRCEAISWGKERVRLTPRGLVVRAARGQIRLRTPSGSRCLGQGHEAGSFATWRSRRVYNRCANPRSDVCHRGPTVLYPSAPIRVVSHFPWNLGPKTVPRTSKPLSCCFERRTAWSRCHRRYPARGLDRCDFWCACQRTNVLLRVGLFTSHWRRSFDMGFARLARRVANRASQFNEPPGRDGLG